MQAALYADEEALLHQQLMIEQDLLSRQAQGPQIQAERTTPKECGLKRKQLSAPHILTTYRPAAIVHAHKRQEEKRRAITRKLKLIRHQISTKKVDNSRGIANLRAAVVA